MSKSNTYTEKEGGPLVDSWMDFAQSWHDVGGQVGGEASKAGSWGFLGVERACVSGCDAWAICRSGLRCGCCEEGRKGFGKSRWPFH